jgi:hypothetical protein
MVQTKFFVRLLNINSIENEIEKSFNFDVYSLFNKKVIVSEKIK